MYDLSKSKCFIYIRRSEMHKIGLQYETTLTVNEQHTAKTMGSGELDVFSTPTMVALMEEAAWRCAAPARRRA